jgi:hypothetical protein
MFTFKVREQIRKRLDSQETATPSHPSTRPWLEILEDRTVPSVSDSTSLSLVLVASPPAAPQVATIPSVLVSMMEQRVQLLATLEQDVSSLLNAESQAISQAVSAFGQRLDSIFGINPTPTTSSSTSSDNGSGRGNASGSGSGSSATTTTHNTQSQQINSSTQQSGSGSGSGSSTTTIHQLPTGAGGMKAHPLLSPGSGGGSGSLFNGSGSGTGSVGHGTGSGYVSVGGQVWLDNNGNGSLDNNELGYSGITVDLLHFAADGSIDGRWSTTTGSTGLYQFSVLVGPDPQPYAIQVMLASVPYRDFVATIPGLGPEPSQIGPQGMTEKFGLADGGWRVVYAGIRSMEVTTTQDDANGPIQNQITLRDAIQSGNKRTGKNVTFINPQNGQALSGTIQLAADLPHIESSYNIDGSGMDTLTVNGNDFQMFYLESNNLCTINGLSVQDGFSGVGGGVYSSGYLTLDSDNITNNKTDGSGGGVANSVGGTMVIKYCTISNNSCAGSGGGVVNYGLLTVYASQIYSNNANYSGGGLSIAPGGTAKVLDASSIYNNKAVDDGGGICNDGSSLIVTSASIRGNTATGAGGVGGRGGGIFSNIGSLTLTMGDEIIKNTAPRGGGIFIKSGNVKMTGGAISSNKAAAYDGAPGGGGGIFLSVWGSLTLTGVQVSLNKVSGGNGAGLYMAIGYEKVTVSGGTFQFNSSLSQGGGIYNDGGTLTLKGGAYFGPDNSADQGGGMYLAEHSETTFNGVTVSGNTASNGGPGVYWQTGATVNPNPPNPPALSDKDDPNGQPVQGP